MLSPTIRREDMWTSSRQLVDVDNAVTCAWGVFDQQCIPLVKKVRFDGNFNVRGHAVRLNYAVQRIAA